MRDSFVKKASDPNVEVIGFWPYPETQAAEKKEAFNVHYRALMFSYGISIQVLDTPSEAVFYDDRPIISIQENRDEGSIDLSDLVHPESAIYIVGNSQYQYPSDHFPVDQVAHISTTNKDHPLCGDQVLAMVLYDKFNKQRKIK